MGSCKSDGSFFPVVVCQNNARKLYRDQRILYYRGFPAFFSQVCLFCGWLYGINSDTKCKGKKCGIQRDRKIFSSGTHTQHHLPVVQFSRYNGKQYAKACKYHQVPPKLRDLTSGAGSKPALLLNRSPDNFHPIANSQGY
jgi:hypothetical protein